MQEDKTKCHRCLKGCSCENLTDHRHQFLAWKCFRLPFCDPKQPEKKHIHGALLTHSACCSHCGVIRLESNDDDDDDETSLNTQPFLNFRNPDTTTLKPPGRFSSIHDESSTIATVAATSSTSNSCHSHNGCNILTTAEIRYVSLDSLLKPMKADGTTSTEVSSTEFSSGTESLLQEAIHIHCKCCQITLSSHWKYCPSCGIYIDTPHTL